MARDLGNRLSSLLESVIADTDLNPTDAQCPDGMADRRSHARFEPVEGITLRLDVLGGIWSARVSDISTESACLRLDPEIAQHIEDGQAASIWLESRQGIPIRLDGSLKSLPGHDATPGDEPISMTFTCESQSPAAPESLTV